MSRDAGSMSPKVKAIVRKSIAVLIKKLNALISARTGKKVALTTKDLHITKYTNISSQLLAIQGVANYAGTQFPFKSSLNLINPAKSSVALLNTKTSLNESEIMPASDTESADQNAVEVESAE